MYEIGKIGFVHQHIERIDQLELIQREMWMLYDQEKEPRHKAAILEKIANVQPYLSAYYEATKMVIQESHSFVMNNSSSFGSSDAIQEKLLASHDNFDSRGWK